MKHVCKRDLMRNPYKHISDEPVIGTQHGNPDLFVSKIDTVANLDNAIKTLNSFKSSLTYEGTTPMKDFSHMADYSSVNLSSNTPPIHGHGQGGADVFGRGSSGMGAGDSFVHGGGGGGGSNTKAVSSIATEIEENKEVMEKAMFTESSHPMQGVATIIDTQTNKPIVKGGRITYAKQKHSHK